MNNTFSNHEPNSKLPLLYWFLMLLSLLFVTTFSSCKPKQITSTHTIEKIVEIKKDSAVTIEKNNQILDSLFIAVGNIKTNNTDCDKIANEEILKLLKQFNTKKISGNNQYGFYFDEIKKMLIAYGHVGETESKETNTIKEKNTQNNDVQIQKIPVKYVPKWIQILAGIGLLFVGFIIVKIYFKIKPV